MKNAKKKIERLMKKHNIIFVLNQGGGAFCKLPKHIDPDDCLNASRLQIDRPFVSFESVLKKLKEWLGEK